MTSTFVQDNALRMNFYKHMQSRRRRRLPHVQRAPSRQPHPFWPTYRGALAWMRKNQDTINTAIGLLDIYPSLIQDSCMDKFWEFIKPYVTQEKAERLRKRPTKPDVQVSGGHEDPVETETVNVKSRVPMISVNGFDDDADDVIRESDMKQRKTRIYVTGEGDEGRLTSPFSKLTSELNTEYTLHRQVPSSHSTPRVCEILADSDIFLFLMSEESVTNPSSYRDLSAAWAMDIPAVFIKPPGFKLPSPLPDSVVMYSMENQRSAIQGRSTQAMSLSATPGLNSGHRTPYRVRSAQPILRPSSVNEGKKNPLVHRESCDLVLMLLNGYREASVWDPINQHRSFKDIQTRIDKLIVRMYHPTPTPSIDPTHSGVFTTGERRNELNTTAAHFLQVPNFEIHSPLNVSCEDLHSTDSEYAGLTLPPINNLMINQSLSDPEEMLSPVEKETCYVLFKDRHSPGHVIKWPPQRGESETDDVFADSPFGFDDLDLTLELKADLDTDCDSPSLF